MELITSFLILIGLLTVAVIIYNKDNSILAILSILALSMVGYFFTIYLGISIAILVFVCAMSFAVAWFGGDELVIGRKWFLLICAFSIFGSIISFFIRNEILSLSFFSVFILGAVAWIKSYDKIWTKHKI